MPRVIVKDYTVPNTDAILPKGLLVCIPVYAVHHDPNYYPNPDVFDPDRFDPTNDTKKGSSSFFPFGDGPRICIGMKLGMLEIKVGLVSLLRNFEFQLSPNHTTNWDTFSKNSVILQPASGLWITCQKNKK